MKELIELLKSKQVTVGVVGLGYVGLPVCLAAAEAGLTVIGFDIDPEKPACLNAGRTYIPHIDEARIATAIAQSRFSAISDFERLCEPDAILVCVPTPLTATREPDLSFVEATCREIAKRLRRGQLVILESTTYPGTTRDVVKPILERSGLVCGEDFLVAFSPEREDPGNTSHSTQTTPKVIGADDPLAREAAKVLYGHFVSETVSVSSTATAEAVKLTENVFRSVNIALVNELKVIFEAMGVDVWEVIDAAKTKPFGFMPFYPGPGLGGHCIPIDPFYLAWKAREQGVETRFIELAGEINTNMPSLVVDRLTSALDTTTGKDVRGARVLIVGLAYKKNVADVRESPALRIMDILEAHEAEVDFYDPHVTVIPKTRAHGSLFGRKSIAWEPEQFSTYDAAIVVTDHDAIDFAQLVEHTALVVDTRNACRRAGIQSDKVVLA